jgi:hypothetical protein
MTRSIYKVSGNTPQETVANALSKTYAFSQNSERVIVIDALAQEVTVLNGTTTGLTHDRDEP